MTDGSDVRSEAWVQPMLNPRDCIHGHLARSCELCERDEEIHDLWAEVERLREALRRIVWAEHRGPDGATESAYMIQVARDTLASDEEDR